MIHWLANSGLVHSFSHHLPLLLLVLVASIALGFAAYWLRNWRIAVAAALLCCWFFDHQAQFASGYDQRVTEDVAAQTKILNERVATLESAAAADKARADADAATIAQLEKRSADTPANSTVSLPLDAVRRIQGVQ